MLPTEGSGQQRKQQKYIFLSPLAPSKALHRSSSRVPCSPVFHFSPTATSHFALILLVFAPHSFLNPESLFPSQLGLFSIVLPAPLCYPPPPSSPVCLSQLNMPPLSINPLPQPGWMEHTLFFLPLSFQAPLFFFVTSFLCPLFTALA